MSFSLSLLLCLVVLLTWPVQGGFYEDLGLTEDATESDIKKSFRKLSRKLHPDHNPSADAKERYQRIQKAYGVLGDRKKKKIYDMMGEEGLKELEDSQRNSNQGMDIFGQLFGGGGGQERGKGQDVRMRLKVSLDDIYNGNTHTVTYAKQKLRSKAVVKDCLKCKSQPPVMKRVQIAPGFVVQQQVAPPCDHVCSGGAKQVQKGYQQTLEVFIEKGIPEGHQLTYEMEADEYPDRLPGDIIFNVQSAPHPVFTRSGDDLLMTQHISLLEALVGFKKSVTHMDGHKVEIARKTVTPPRFQISIPNEGMPKHNVPSEKGKLIVTFEVDFPSSITAEQAQAFKDILR